MGFLKKSLNYLAICTVFSEAFSFNIPNLFQLKISYLILIPILLYIFYNLKILCFNKYFLLAISFISISSIINIIIGNNSLFLFLKQLLGILFHAIVFYTIIKLNKNNLSELFKVYLNLAFLIASFGIIQEISYLFHIKPIYDLSYLLPNWRFPIRTNTNFLRINSILPEPSTFCIVMLPAVFTSFHALFKNNKNFLNRTKSAIIIISVFSSLSLLGYIGMSISIFILTFHMFRQKFIILSCTCVALILAVSYFSIPEFKERVNDTSDVLLGNKKIETTNLSTFTLLSNAIITLEVLKQSPIFGFGLGSHEISYNKNIDNIVEFNPNRLLLNKKDANSLLLRILSETGIIGLFFLLIFLIKYFVKENRSLEISFRVINNAVLIFFIIRLIRQGHYFNDGIFFFFWLYYFTGSQYRLERSKQKKNC